MKHIDDSVSLTPNQTQALHTLQQRLRNIFEIDALIVYGSVARGEADVESDLDLLVVTEALLERIVRHEITNMVCEINLEYGTNISTLVVDRDTWESGPISVLPIHEAILSEGILL